MTWRPLLDDADGRLAARVREQLDATPPVDLDAAVDRALLHAYLGIDDAGDALTAAITMMTERPHSASLYGGAARVGWAVAHLADGDQAEEVCVAIDRRVARAIPAAGVDELVGYGVYALERGHEPLAVLDALEHRGGLTHGVVALLARFVAAGMMRARPLLELALRARRGTQPPCDLGVPAALIAGGAIDEGLALARACAAGSIGDAHALNRMWQATGDEALAAAARARLADAVPGDAADALAVHAAITDDEPLWDRLRLL